MYSVVVPIPFRLHGLTKYHLIISLLSSHTFILHWKPDKQLNHRGVFWERWEPYGFAHKEITKTVDKLLHKVRQQRYFFL